MWLSPLGMWGRTCVKRGPFSNSVMIKILNLFVIHAGERAEWHLDNVMLLANETLPLTLYDNFEGEVSSGKTWFLISGGKVLNDSCSSDGPVLAFSPASSTRILSFTSI